MSVKDNQFATKFGGEGAVRRLSEGKSFIGLAADEQRAVEAELKDNGQAEIVKGVAIRLQSALNLYFHAVEKAAADGDLTAFDRYTARFGWLAGCALRAWQQVAINDKTATKYDPSKILDVYRDKDGNNAPNS